MIDITGGHVSELLQILFYEHCRTAVQKGFTSA